MSTRRVTDRLGGLAFGGDYNPEQWDEPVRRQDDELMRRVMTVDQYPNAPGRDAAVVGRLLTEAGVGPEPPGLPPGVEAVARRAPDGRAWRFLLDHRAEVVQPTEPGHDLLTGGPLTRMPPGGCAVLTGAAPATAEVLAPVEVAL